MNIQRLRNLTTGILHTKIEHVLEDIEKISGITIDTHSQLPYLRIALEPYLREKVPDARFWNGKHDIHHTGEIDIPLMDRIEQNAMRERYNKMPSLCAPIESGLQ